MWSAKGSKKGGSSKAFKGGTKSSEKGGYWPPVVGKGASKGASTSSWSGPVVRPVGASWSSSKGSSSGTKAPSWTSTKASTPSWSKGKASSASSTWSKGKGGYTTFGKGFGKDKGKGKGKGKKGAPHSSDPYWAQKAQEENRQPMDGGPYTGIIQGYNGKHGWGFVLPDEPGTLPEDVQSSLVEASEQQRSAGKTVDQDYLIYFRKPDLKCKPERGTAVTFQLYTDDKGIGASEINAVEGAETTEAAEEGALE